MEMRHISIDTNIYVAFKQGNADVVSALRRCDSIGVDVTVIAELLSGFKYGGKEKKNRSDLETFLDTPRVRILDHDFSTAEFYAILFNHLKKNGTPVPTNDIWIAANALRFGIALLTLDNHFNYFNGLALVKL
jgi:tRNA(fMet)-specific endonuclease VapC